MFTTRSLSHNRGLHRPEVDHASTLLLLLNPAVDLCKVDEVHRDGFSGFPPPAWRRTSPSACSKVTHSSVRPPDEAPITRDFICRASKPVSQAIPGKPPTQLFLRMFQLITHQSRGQFDCVKASGMRYCSTRTICCSSVIATFLRPDRVGPLGEGPMSGLHQAKELVSANTSWGSLVESFIFKPSSG